MRTIHKFGPFNPCEMIEIPVCNFVAFDFFSNGLFIWGEVDLEEDAPQYNRRFLIVGTGMAYESYWTHKASTIAQGYVWHCLEEE